MNLSHSGFRDDALDIIFANPSARHDSESVPGTIHEACHRGKTFFHSLMTARGEKPVDSRLQDVIQSAVEVRAHIERAVKRCAQGLRRLDQFTRSFDVDTAVQIQNAEDYAICAEVLRSLNVTDHDCELVGAVTEVSGPGADHYVQGNGVLCTDAFDESDAGSNSAFEQVAAKFQAVRAAPLRYQGGLDRIDADLKEQGCLHRVVREFQE